MDDAFAAAGVACRRFTVDSAMMAAGLAGAGLGCAVMHPIKTPNLPPGVATRPFRPAIGFTYALLECEPHADGRILDRGHVASPFDEEGCAKPRPIAGSIACKFVYKGFPSAVAAACARQSCRTRPAFARPCRGH